LWSFDVVPNPKPKTYGRVEMPTADRSKRRNHDRNGYAMRYGCSHKPRANYLRRSPNTDKYERKRTNKLSNKRFEIH
jgi:hypothetical protein